MGETILHGPHQGAQKSITKRGYRAIACAKLESVSSIGVEITAFLRLSTLAALNNLLLFLARISSSSLSSFCTLDFTERNNSVPEAIKRIT